MKTLIYIEGMYMMIGEAKIDQNGGTLLPLVLILCHRATQSRECI